MKYNLSKIMKKAWELVKNTTLNMSDALKVAWKIAKEALVIKNVVIAHFDYYNSRRYSNPWVCIMNEDGTHDFKSNTGTYTGESGDEGDLIVYRPEVGKVYGWGQKDYRGNNTRKNYCKWNGTEFVACDKLGR